MDTAGTSVAEGRETPISCPSCGGHVQGILVTLVPETVHLIPCEHYVTMTALLGRPARSAA